MIKVVLSDQTIDRWAAKVDGNLQAFASEFIQDLNNEVVFDTPVRFGFLRGSWFSALNGNPVGTGSKDPSGAASAGRMNLVAMNLTLGDVYRAVNAAVYAARVEYGFFGRDSLGRNYSQQGRGWVRAVMSRVQQIGNAAADRARLRS